MASWLQQQASQAASQPGRYAMRASQDLEPEESNRTPPSVRRGSAALRASVLEIPSDMSPGRSERAFRTGNERLYEAYNDLHALAQDFEKPFDAPAILVVGHQTDGKSGEPSLAARMRGPWWWVLNGVLAAARLVPCCSASHAALLSWPAAGRQLPTSTRRCLPAALVEALMGFQFNHVGGGTKTRRPITLHMKYNSACVQPHCYLITDEFGEQEATLEELQVRRAYWRAAIAAEGVFVARGTCRGGVAVKAVTHVTAGPPCPSVGVVAVRCSCCGLIGPAACCCLPPAPQDYIENENARLDREAQFWSKEIVVRIEYKFCPNLTIIDTPGGHRGGGCGPTCLLLPAARCCQPIGALTVVAFRAHRMPLCRAPACAPMQASSPLHPASATARCRTARGRWRPWCA